MNKLKSYYWLTKPGIIYGNAITAIAGFLFASGRHVDLGVFFAMLAGLAFVIASGCVFNNYLDRDIDVKMERTKNRALVNGDISGRNALIFASLLGLCGIFILGLCTNILTLFVALVGAIVYVLLYTPIKRESVYGTLVGSISGATPVVIGYVSVTNSFDTAALILFIILVLWQMPHFYAVAIRRFADYADAGIPVLPVKAGIRAAKIHILAYVIAFILAALSLAFFDSAGYVYACSMLIIGAVWLWLGITGFRKGIDDHAWARRMFFFSLLVLMVFSLSIAIDAYLP